MEQGRLKALESPKMIDKSFFETQNTTLKTRNSNYPAFCLFHLALVFLIAGCGMGSGDSIKAYNDFGVKCARMGLWNEAIMRWTRVVEIDPDNAQAHNNLGVAYESKGKFDAAMVEYKTAIELDPDNKTYVRNYVKFKRNYEQASKRKNETQDPGPETQDQELKTEDSRLTTQD